MPRYQLYFLLANFITMAFVVAFGACIGSLTNVIVYRMPRGQSIVTPPSRCPSCGTQLTWRENIPVIGWLLLRGKCRFCQSKISPRYPIVEASVAAMFGVFYLLWYIVPDPAVFLGVHWGAIKPEWAMNGIRVTWPEFIVMMTLLSCLFSMLLLDFETFTVPLKLAWIPTIVALLVHPGHALIRSLTGSGELVFTAGNELWSLSTPGYHGWWWIGASIGASVGVVASMALLHFGLIRRSFADYDEWEARALAEARATKAVKADETSKGDPAASPDISSDEDSQEDSEEDGEDRAPDIWIQYPHARREMFKEVTFLALPLALGLAGGWIAERLAGPIVFDPFDGTVTSAQPAPLWLTVLAGVLIGYLVGGAVVWGVRIVGSLLFGKEAMGLGDVHVVAAIGACLGWIDAVLVFFGAAFVGIFLVLATTMLGRGFQRTLAYVPNLAIAAMLVLLFRPLLESLFSELLKMQVHLP